jgi:hypothetical protein
MRIYVVYKLGWNRSGEIDEIEVLEAFEDASKTQICKAGGRDRLMSACELKTKQKGTF